ncbi:MAG: hypothetical protein IT385_20030 [Deltaproteobacteria bacterium]|nr:hypothetical protein [Deltaproteobacteria bacterium]
MPIQRGQLVLYKLAVTSPEDGFTAEQVRQVLDIDQAQHRGLMAALTVRINNTPHETSPGEKPGLGLVLRQKWDGTQNTYWPTPELLSAFERLPPLRDLLVQPIDAVLGAGPLVVTLPDDVPAEPPIPAPAAPPPAIEVTPFRALLADLEAKKLVFPSELVANLILALQVKRFVILTGISGTGKTRIGQALAARFEATRREPAVGEVDDLTTVVQVQPYMIKRARIVVPVALSSQLPTAKKGAGRMMARWPGGDVEVATYRRKSAFIVLFKGALREWFLSTFTVGASMVLRVELSTSTDPETIVFDVPREENEVRVRNAAVVAVQPDWTDHRGLLGHYNPLTKRYVRTPFLRLLLDAHGEAVAAQAEGRQPSPYFALLDEMNLARVEHYFADFLSALESGEALSLHDDVNVEEGAIEPGEAAIPRRLEVPHNLFFIGTVNVDESTYLFSPKVLDRAFAIELDTVDLDGLAHGMPKGSELDLVGWSGRLDPPTLPTREDWQWLQAEQPELARHVRGVHAELARHHRHFGYRVANELARFVRLAVEQTEDPEAAAWDALDLALLQKVLVKLNGTQAELQELLDALLGLMLVGADGPSAAAAPGLWRLDPVAGVVVRRDESSDMEAVFPRAAAKLWRMRDRLRRQGFTSWIE